MNITLSARHSSISENTKKYAKEKVEKLAKFDKLRKVSIVMDVEGENNYTIEIVVHPERGGKAIVANSKASEWFAAIDQACDKIERQLRKFKEKVKSRRLKKSKMELKEDSRDSRAEKEEREETYEDIVDQMGG